MAIESIRFKNRESKEKLCNSKLFLEKNGCKSASEICLGDLKGSDNNLRISTPMASYSQELIEECEKIGLTFCFYVVGKNGSYNRFRSSDRKISIEKCEVIEGFIPEHVLEKAKTERFNELGSNVHNYFATLSQEYDIILERY